jgi:hypothetical protein
LCIFSTSIVSKYRRGWEQENVKLFFSENETYKSHKFDSGSKTRLGKETKKFEENRPGTVASKNELKK